MQFIRPRSIHWNAESHCTGWHVEGAYDTVVEVKPSRWIAGLVAAQPEHLREKFEMHHYMLYLDSAGLFEVAAASWELLAEQLVG